MRRYAQRWSHGLRMLVLFLVCVVVLFPIYWMFVTAVQLPATTLRYPPALWPTSIDMSGFTELFDNLPMARWLSNSTLVAGLSTVITTVLSIIGAYALSAFNWTGKTAFALLLLVTQMMPEAIVVIPVFELYNKAQLLQSLSALSLLHAAFVLPVGIWILRSAMDGVPRELSEAACIEGATHMQVLRFILVPLTAPAIAAVAIVAFFASWGEYLFATTLITNAASYPASVGLATLIGQLDTPVAQLLAGGLVYALPPVVLFIIVQRYIIAGLTTGGVKG